LLLYGQALLFIFKNWTGLIYTKDFVHKDGIWLMKTNFDSPWFIAFSIISVLISIGSLTLLHIWGKTTKTTKEVRQAKIMKNTLIITFILATIESILTPSLTGYRTIGFGSLAIGIWIGGILYCFLRYRFLNLTTDIVSHELLNNISDGVALLDNNMDCVFINEIGRKLFNIKGTKKASINFFSGFQNSSKITDEILSMQNGKFKSIACRMKLKSKQNHIEIFDSRISLVNDRFNDPLGIMVIARQIHQMKQLKNLYKITERENEIIENLISGKTNQEISNVLDITIRTVKTHITSIYTKLELSNKVQLLNKLKEYEILPQKNAEKRLLLLKNE